MFGTRLGGVWHWKVPFREVYCDRLITWVQETIWCLVICKLFSQDIEALVGAPASLPSLPDNDVWGKSEE